MEKGLKEFEEIDAKSHLDFEKNYLPLLKKIEEKYAVNFSHEDGVYLVDKETGVVIDLYDYGL